MKGVIYARYSGDRQRETSIDDQVRNCTRCAERENIMITHDYHDKAISGAVRSRPGYQEMLSDAAGGAFDVLIVDDLSRLSRDDYEMKGVLRKFTWQGIRIIGVTDGYDSARKGHKIHAGFKGLMNEMFLDDLRERTHRGMTGQALKGFNCGGRTYGYCNVPIEDSVRVDAYGRPAVTAVRYEVDDDQAAIVRRIFAWYAAGYSYKWIASHLNQQRVPSSRGKTWAVSAIKVILDNEMYEGRVVWNRKQWMKHPDTGRRTYRERPRAEWIVTESPGLRIVPQDIIEAVRHRQRKHRETGCGRAQASSAQRYLFSGLMVCAECDGSMVIIAKGRYGCAVHKARGPCVCGNSISVSRHIVEERLLNSIKQRLLDPQNFERFQLAAADVLQAHNERNRLDDLQRQLKTAQRERDNVMNAIKQGVVTASTKEALQSAEAEIDELKQQISHACEWQVPVVLPRAIERYRRAVSDLEGRLMRRVEPAREILRSLLGDRIRIHRKGEHLEAEIPHHVPAILANVLNSRFDLAGCGGEMCNESYFVSLEPRNQDSAPRKRWRSRRIPSATSNSVTPML